MKKIEKAMCEAVNAQKSWKSGNTEVRVRKSISGNIEVAVYLFGNKIMEQYEDGDGKVEMFFSLAGWNTNTTRSRLNALGIEVRQKKGEPMWNGGRINPYGWYDALEV